MNPTSLVAAFVLLSVFLFLKSSDKRAHRNALVERLARFDLEIVNLRLWEAGTRSNRHYEFDFTAKREGDPTIYQGHGEFYVESNKPVIEWEGPNPTRGRSLINTDLHDSMYSSRSSGDDSQGSSW